MIMQRFERGKSATLRVWQTLRRLGIAGGAVAAVALGFASWPADMVQTALAQTTDGRAQALITQPVNDGNLVTLAGNTRPEAKIAANDRGRVDDAMPMPHLMLQLRRPPAQEEALAKLIDQLHDPNSPNYHHWLTADQIGAQFGPAASDIAKRLAQETPSPLAKAWLMVRFSMVADTASVVLPMKKARYLSAPLIVRLFVPPSITVPLPRIRGSSCVRVMLCPAMELSKVIVVPAFALAYAIADRKVPEPVVSTMEFTR